MRRFAPMTAYGIAHQLKSARTLQKERIAAAFFSNLGSQLFLINRVYDERRLARSKSKGAALSCR